MMQQASLAALMLRVAGGADVTTKDVCEAITVS